jgi:hypothetical protein
MKSPKVWRTSNLEIAAKMVSYSHTIPTLFSHIMFGQVVT